MASPPVDFAALQAKYGGGRGSAGSASAAAALSPTATAGSAKTFADLQAKYGASSSSSIGSPGSLGSPRGSPAGPAVGVGAAAPAAPLPAAASSPAKPTFESMVSYQQLFDAKRPGASLSPASASPTVRSPAAAPTAGSSALSTAAPRPLEKAYTAAPRLSSAEPTPGLLKIMLKRGVGLKAADFNGKSDPYVIVRTGGMEKKSKVIQKTLDPVWNESIEFYGDLNDFIATGLTLRVFDKDTFTRDDPLGDARVSLEEMRSKIFLDYMEKLPTQGSILFSVSWLPDKPKLTGSATMAALDLMRPKPPPAPPDAPRPPLPAERNTQGVLKILLMRAVGLLAADFNGLSDPYVLVRSGKAPEKRSKTIKRSLDPVCPCACACVSARAPACVCVRMYMRVHACACLDACGARAHARVRAARCMSDAKRGCRWRTGRGVALRRPFSHPARSHALPVHTLCHFTPSARSPARRCGTRRYCSRGSSATFMRAGSSCASSTRTRSRATIR